MKKLLFYYLKPYYLRMAMGFSLKFTGTIMDLFLPWALARMIDTVIPEQRVDGIAKWGVFMLACSILALAFNVIPNRMASRVASDTIYEVRRDLFAKIMYLTNSSADEFTRPSLISRLTSDTYNVHQMLARMQRLGVRAPILLIGGLVMTLMMDPVLASILLATLPLLTVTVVMVSRKSIPMFGALQDSVDRFVRLVREDIAGIRVIKALSKETYERRRFDQANRDVVELERSATVTTAVTNPVMNILLNLGLVAVIVVGAYRVNSGTSEVGRILAFMTYFAIILNALLSISRMFIMVSKGTASANRIDQVLEAESEEILMALDDEHDPGEGPAQYHVEFRNVSFSYGKVKPNLQDICFGLKRGETLGIVGATGSGKSTVLSLLMRFYDIDEGTILIDGVDVRAMELRELRSRFGTVFQNDTIFEDTVLENIRLRRQLTEDEVMAAAVYARAKEFVAEKGGLNELLDIRGANLSGGQKQRLLISRALAAHPQILILDDSFSALDYQTDAAVRRELKAHFADTTCMIVAQRISSIMGADHIMVLEEGQIIGYGSHEELMETCDVYREIGSSQIDG